MSAPALPPSAAQARTLLPQRSTAGRRARPAARSCRSTPALAVAYLFLPIAVMIAFCFNDPRGRQNITWQGFTFGNYLDVWSRPDITGPMVTSLTVALVSTMVATMLGTLIAPCADALPVRAGAAP